MLCFCDTEYNYYCINVNLFISRCCLTDDSTEGLQTEDLMTDLNCVQLPPDVLDFPTQPLPGGFFVHNSRWVPKRSEPLVGLRQRHTSVSHWQLKAHLCLFILLSVKIIYFSMLTFVYKKEIICRTLIQNFNIFSCVYSIKFYNISFYKFGIYQK